MPSQFVVDDFGYTPPGLRTINVGTLRITNIVGTDDFSTSDLVSPLSADESWLSWVGRLYGVTVDTSLSISTQRSSIQNGYTGFKAGTKNAVASLVATQLTGTKDARILTHTSNTGTIGGASQWDVCILTRGTETPVGLDIPKFVTDQGAKPVGVTLWARTLTASWATMESLWPHWSDWDGMTWDQIEEAGLS